MDEGSRKLRRIGSIKEIFNIVINIVNIHVIIYYRRVCVLTIWGSYISEMVNCIHWSFRNVNK